MKVSSFYGYNRVKEDLYEKDNGFCGAHTLHRGCCYGGDWWRFVARV